MWRGMAQARARLTQGSRAKPIRFTSGRGLVALSHALRHSLPSPTPVRRANLTTLILDQLRQYVITHGLSENDRLPPERDLAIRLRVSRPSLRNALDWLSERGALKRVQGGGTFLQGNFLDVLADAPGTLSDDPTPAELAEARLLVEPGLVRLAAQRITSNEIASLDRELARVRQRLADPSACRQHDLQFHIRLAQLSGNTLLAATIEGFMAHAMALWNTQPSETDPAQVVADHQEIVSCLARQDGDAAARRMAEHLAGGCPAPADDFLTLRV